MNWSEFFYRGGYGFYVWGSYLIALLAMSGEVILLRRRRKSLGTQLQRTVEREKYEDQA